MCRKNVYILFFIFILSVFPVFSQPQKKIYITLDTSGSMYGDKYMISNYTAQLIALLGRNDDVYMICNGLPKKISGNIYSYKQIQFDYSLVRAKWGISSLGTQIGDIAAFNDCYLPNQKTQQWLFIIGDGNWQSYEFPQIMERFSNIVRNNHINVFFIPYGNITDGQSDFVDYLHTLRTPKILNGSRSLQSVMSNSIIIFSYLTGYSCKSIQITSVGNNTVKIISPLLVKKYILFYQDETDEKQILQPLSATQDTVNYTVNYTVNFIGNPSTSPLRYKDNQTLLTACVWEISGEKTLEADIPLIIRFDKYVNIKKLKLFPVYDLIIKSNNNYIETNPLKVNEVSNNFQTNNKQDLSRKNTLEKTEITEKISISNHKPKKANRNSEINSSSESAPATIRLEKIKDKDSVNIYKASVRLKNIIDTSEYRVEISHNKPFLFKKTKINVDHDKITFTLEQRGKWSEAFIPDTIVVKAKFSPKTDTNKDTIKLTPTIYELKCVTSPNGIHTNRNKNLKILFITFFILILYFFALSVKARFKRDSFLDYYSGGKADKIFLREKGLRAWLNRWFNPLGAEKREITFFNVSKTLVFTANHTKYSIRLLKKQLDTETMSYKVYYQSKRYIEFIENRELFIKNNPYNYVSIKYDSAPSIQDDCPLFRIFAIGISILFIIGLVFI